MLARILDRIRVERLGKRPLTFFPNAQPATDSRPSD